MKKIFSIIIATLILSPCFSQKVDLKLNLKVGTTYKQVTVSEASITQEVSGQTMEIIMKIEGDMSYLVNSSKEGNYEMEVRYDRLAMTMKMPQGEMSFSSEKNDESDILSSILGEMRNKPFNITMTQKGKVLVVKNMDVLLESVFSKFTDIPEAQLNQIKTQLEKSYGENGLKGNIEMVSSIFPEKPVAIGDQWKVETNLESGMKATLSSTYKYVEKTSDYILINGESKVATVASDEYTPSNGLEVKLDLSGTMKSEIKIDPKTGWTIEARILQNLQGESIVKPNAQLPEGMTIPMQMKTNMVITN